MDHQTARQLALPHIDSPEEALADMYERLVALSERLIRIESKLTKLCLHAGLDEHGNSPRKPRGRHPT